MRADRTEFSYLEAYAFYLHDEADSEAVSAIKLIPGTTKVPEPEDIIILDIALRLRMLRNIILLPYSPTWWGQFNAIHVQSSLQEHSEYCRSHRISLLEVLSTCVLRREKLNSDKTIARKSVLKKLDFTFAFLYLIANPDTNRAPTERNGYTDLPGVCRYEWRRRVCSVCKSARWKLRNSL
jgi:hypothetical protein